MYYKVFIALTQSG